MKYLHFSVEQKFKSCVILILSYCVFRIRRITKKKCFVKPHPCEVGDTLEWLTLMLIITCYFVTSTLPSLGKMCTYPCKYKNMFTQTQPILMNTHESSVKNKLKKYKLTVINIKLQKEYNYKIEFSYSLLCEFLRNRNFQHCVK